MKHTKKASSLLLALALCLALALPALAEGETGGTCGENLTWTLDGDGTLTIRGTGPMDDYFTYSELSFAPAPWYDQSAQVRAVAIEDGVTSIGACAFFHCGDLTEVSIPDSVVSIGWSGFFGCQSLTNIRIPVGVASIGGGAFSGAPLAAIDVDEDNPVYSSLDGTLFNKDRTELIRCPEGIDRPNGTFIPDGVVSISDRAFENCAGLTGVVLPDTLERIGDAAFQGCAGLTGVTVPGSVSDMGEYVFSNCAALREATFGYGVAAIPGWTFFGDGSLTDVTIPKSVASIGMSAFTHCDSLADVWYGGSEEQWDAVEIKFNASLTKAEVHYDSAAGTPAEEPTSEKLARSLYALGLFRGVGETADGAPDFDLDRAPTRLEALVMLIRMLGKDAEAENYEKTHPFADVPEWADGYVSWAWDNGLAMGVSETEFDCGSPAIMAVYLTYTLRALGYRDGEGLDFTWDRPNLLAKTLGLDYSMSKLLGYDVVPGGDFLRADAAEITAQALYANRKGATAPLYAALIADGAFTAEEFAATELYRDVPGSLAGTRWEFDSYDAAMEYLLNIGAVSEPDAVRITWVDARLETGEYTVLYQTSGGVMRAPAPKLWLAAKPGSPLGEGLVIELPLLPAASNAAMLPDALAVAEDGRGLVYTYGHGARYFIPDWNDYGELPGTFRYTVDPDTGVTAVNFS